MLLSSGTNKSGILTEPYYITDCGISLDCLKNYKMNLDTMTLTMISLLYTLPIKHMDSKPTVCSQNLFATK